MKCPYAVHRITTTTTEHQYDEESKHIRTNEETTNQAVFVDCMKEECGAWQNGKCNYRGVD